MKVQNSTYHFEQWIRNTADESTFSDAAEAMEIISTTDNPKLRYLQEGCCSDYGDYVTQASPQE